METVNERVLIFMNLLELSPAGLGNAIGMSGQTVYNIVAGNLGKPSYAFLSSLKTAYPQLDLNWLVVGIGVNPNDVIGKVPKPVTYQQVFAKAYEPITESTPTPSFINEVNEKLAYLEKMVKDLTEQRG
jgi:hypothetical protein